MKMNLKDLITIFSGFAVIATAIVGVVSIILQFKIDAAVSAKYEDVAKRAVTEVSVSLSEEVNNLDNSFNKRFDRIESFYTERFKFTQDQIDYLSQREAN